MLVHEILEHSRRRLPEKTALIEGDEKLTYAQLQSQVEALSARLVELGVVKGDRVALLFPNCLEFCISYFAALRVGAIVVPLNNRLAPQEFTYIVNDASPKIMILGYQFWDVYQSFKDQLTSQPDLIHAGPTPQPGADFFADLVKDTNKTVAAPVMQPDDPACIMYTSGTTGLPKGAVMSHRNIFTNARNAGTHLRYGENDTTLVVVPLFHVTGLNTQLVALIYVGGTIVIMRNYTTTDMIRLLEKNKITTMITVPTMYVLMLASPDLNQADLSSLKVLSYGGAPMDGETIKALKKRLGVDLMNAYGLTETSSITTAMPACDTERKGDSVGLSATGIQLRVVDRNENDLGPDEVGELWVKGPNVVSSYWNKPEATVSSLGGGWLRTGDYARIDDEGFVYIVDRMKDMINRGGENIYSIEVESALLSNPKVLEAAVVPRPHTIFGEVVHAFVVSATEDKPTEEEIIKGCEGLIADYKIPASVTVLDALPRNPGGKVLKPKLRELVPAGDPPRRN